MPDAEIHQLPPLVKPEEPIPVEVAEGYDRWPGMVLAWRGDRVYVRYNKGIGANYLAWLPSSQVRRTAEDAPTQPGG